MDVLVIPSWFPDGQNKNWDHGQISGSFFLEQAQELNKFVNVQIVYIKIHSLKKFKIKNCFNLFSYSWENENGIYTARLNAYNLFPKSTKGLVLQYRIYSNILFFLLRLTKQFKIPKVVHCHSPFFGGVVAMHASKKFNAKLIFTEHSKQHPDYILPYENKIYKQIIYNSSRIIALSNYFFKFLEIDHNVPRKKISLLPNMIPRFCLEQVSVKKYGKEKFTFIFIGSLIDLKRPLDLLESFAGLDHEVYPCQLKIIGKGPLYKDCLKFIEQNKLNEKVLLLGELSRKETISHLSASNCLCSVSTTESFGISILEAISMGIPVISTKSGGPQDIINSHNGILVDIGNKIEIRNAMVNLLKNIKSYDKEMIKKACLQKYHPNIILNKLISIYED